MDRCIFCGVQVHVDAEVGGLYDGSGERYIDYVCADTPYEDGNHRLPEPPC